MAALRSMMMINPTGPLNRDGAGGYLVIGRVPEGFAVHTKSDIPVSAHGPGSSMFSGVMDSADVFLKAMQAALGGTRIRPEALW